MAERISFEFHGREEALEIVNTGGQLVKYLTTQNAVCPLIGSKIKLAEHLGRGVQGDVFLIEFEGMGEKEYVVKVLNHTLSKETFFIPIKKSLREIAKAISKLDDVFIETIIAVNGNKPEKEYERGEYSFNIPDYARPCRTKSIRYYENLKYGKGKGKRREEIIIPKGSYLCQETEYSEYIIGILCGDLYRKRISVNFIDFFSFASCPVKNEPDVIRNYVFMQKISGSFTSFKSCIIKKDTEEKYYNPEILNVLYIQILHAISVYQRQYKLSHNDLHTENIFIELIKKGTKYDEQELSDADWFHYHIDGVDIYLPYVPMLVKIGDFGLSFKFSEPMIGDEYVIEDGYDQDDGVGAVVPNWYAPSYDSVYMTRYIYVDNTDNDFLRKIMGWIIDPDEREPKKSWINKKAAERFEGMDGTRPALRMLSGEFGKFAHATAENILKNKNLMGKYLEVPTSGKIVTLGRI